MNKFDRWAQLCRDLGAAGDVRRAYLHIVDMYRTPVRQYHNLKHVEDCLCKFDLIRDMAVQPAAVEGAIWFHDAVYNSKASDNEEKSAAVAVEILAGLGVAGACCEAVRKLILVTKHAALPRTRDGKIIVDVDLSILGAPSVSFVKYERGIRKEYRWVEDSVFWPKRAEVLRMFLARKRIFATDFFFRRFETKARRNINKSIRSAEKRLQQTQGIIWGHS